MIVLHILWLILRTLLIILGILLGLVLLILLLVLFCPVRYRARVTKETERLREIWAEVSVDWLFRGIHLIISFQNGKLNPDIHVFGISLKKVKGFLDNRKRKSQTEALPKPSKTDTQSADEKRLQKVDRKEEEPCKTEAPRNPMVSEELPLKQKEPKGTTTQDTKPSSGSEKLPLKQKEPKETTTQDTKPSSGSGSFIGRLLDRLDSFLENLGENLEKKLEGIQAKKEALEKKVDAWKDFLTHPSTKEALSLVWKKVIHLVRHVMPTKMAGELSFGFEDPSITGWVLMIMGMTIPLHKNAVALSPDFEGENHIEGTLWVKGRIYGIVFVVTALRILLDKHVRNVYHRYKNKEE